jgi:general secretion pathway protein K
VDIRKLTGRMKAKERDEAFVLVAVIWIAGILAVFATSFAVMVRSHTLAGMNAVHNARAESIADGLVQYSALKLASSVAADTSGGEWLCRWSKIAIARIIIQDQGGLIDINTASPMLVEALLRGLGQNAQSAAKILASLKDFRDPDSLAQNGRAEPMAYDGYSFGPKNEPFSAIEEVDQIPDIDDALFQRLLPLITITSQQTGFDADVAPKSLLKSLETAGVTPGQMLLLTSPTAAKAFAIEVTAKLDNGSVYARKAEVVLLRQPDRPFAILGWQRAGDVPEFEAKGELPPCVN